jgi:hypothetical protein
MRSSSRSMIISVRSPSLRHGTSACQNSRSRTTTMRYSMSIRKSSTLSFLYTMPKYHSSYEVALALDQQSTRCKAHRASQKGVTHIDFVGYHSSRQVSRHRARRDECSQIFRNVQTVTLDIAIEDLIMRAGSNSQSLGWRGVDDVEER